MTIPLDLFIEVTTASGATYKWDANQPPGSRLRDFSFRTKLGDGFSDATGSLARRIDFDYPDLELLNDFRAVGADGSIAYEGRISAMPRELGDTHSVGVQLAGYMAHARDQPFREVFVDRDMSAWGPPSLKRKAAILAANYFFSDTSQTTDPTDQTPAISTQLLDVWAAPFMPLSEAWYDAGAGIAISSINYSWKRRGGTGTAAPWSWAIGYSSADSGGSASSNLAAAGPATLQTFTPATPSRYISVQFGYNSTPGGGAGNTYAVDWYKLALYGSSGIPTSTGQAGEPPGVLASDVIKNIASRFCPLLDTSGVVPTTYVIQHLAFKDLTDPYDAFLQVNKYHLWHLGVWDNRVLTFRPYNLTDYDWEIRTDDPGTSFSPQGPSTDDLVNGMVVTYDDLLTGKKEIITPTDDSSLADGSASNPWNKVGVQRWGTTQLSTPTLAAQAAQIGRAVLADRNRPKAPGTITASGYIRDRAGNEQPVWKVRAGDTIAITNFPNDSPRLIHETSYDDESKVVTLSIEAPASAMDAVFDRIGTALTAAGLG